VEGYLFGLLVCCLFLSCDTLPLLLSLKYIPLACAEVVMDLLFGL
jgi:hypothetical protein